MRILLLSPVNFEIVVFYETPPLLYQYYWLKDRIEKYFFLIYFSPGKSIGEFFIGNNKFPLKLLLAHSKYPLINILKPKKQ